MNRQEILSALTNPNDAQAYAKTQELIALSARSGELLPYVADFAQLMVHPKSYIRMRGFLLCSAQLCRMPPEQIQTVLPQMLCLLHDEKPTVVRQCLQNLQTVAAELVPYSQTVTAELDRMNCARYAASVAGLIRKDREALYQRLKKEEKKP